MLPYILKGATRAWHTVPLDSLGGGSLVQTPIPGPPLSCNHGTRWGPEERGLMFLRWGLRISPQAWGTQAPREWRETWPLWLSWLGVVLQSKRSPVQFPLRARAWFEGSLPGGGTWERQPIDVSLPLFLPSFSSLYKYINKIFLKKRREPWLGWLSESDVVPQAETSLIWFPVRAHAWFSFPFSPPMLREAG